MAQKKFLWTSIFAIFDDFQVFWMETWTLPHFSRGSRKSGSFLRQLNGYLAVSTFRNRKYRTALFFSNLKSELCFLTNEDQLSHANYLKIAVWRCPESNIRYFIHFRTDSTQNISDTCELTTQNLRLETITNLQTLPKLEKEVKGRFYHNINYTNKQQLIVVIIVSDQLKIY